MFLRFSGAPEPPSVPGRGWFRRKQLHRAAGAQRPSYDLRERICIGSLTAMETAVYQKVPTDEAEAQMLASADLDDMKSKSWASSRDHAGLLSPRRNVGLGASLKGPTAAWILLWLHHGLNHHYITCHLADAFYPKRLTVY